MADHVMLFSFWFLESSMQDANEAKFVNHQPRSQIQVQILS